MRSKQSYAIAASLAVVAIALPATLYHLKQSASFRPLSAELPASQTGASDSHDHSQHHRRGCQPSRHRVAGAPSPAAGRAAADCAADDGCTAAGRGGLAKAKDEAAKKLFEVAARQTAGRYGDGERAGGRFRANDPIWRGHEIRGRPAQTRRGRRDRKTKPAVAAAEPKPDAGATGTRQVETVQIDKDGRVQGGTSVRPGDGAIAASATCSAVSRRGRRPAAPAAPAAPQAPPSRAATVLFPSDKLSIFRSRRSQRDRSPLPGRSNPHRAATKCAAPVAASHDQPAPRVEEARDRFAAAEPQPVQVNGDRAGLDVLRRCRHGVVCVRAPHAQRRPAAAARGRAHRGDDQLFPL